MIEHLTPPTWHPGDGGGKNPQLQSRHHARILAAPPYNRRVMNPGKGGTGKISHSARLQPAELAIRADQLRARQLSTGW